MVDRAQAGGSMRPGSIDLMMHRRITQDDHRGVGEPLLEPGQFGDGLMVRGSHYIVPGLVNDVKHKTLEENILQKPQVFFWDGQYQSKLIWIRIKVDRSSKKHKNYSWIFARNGSDVKKNVLYHIQ